MAAAAAAPLTSGDWNGGNRNQGGPGGVATKLLAPHVAHFSRLGGAFEPQAAQYLAAGTDATGPLGTATGGGVAANAVFPHLGHFRRFGAATAPQDVQKRGGRFVGVIAVTAAAVG